MNCLYSSQCGGCPYRNLSDAEYRKLKQNNLSTVLNHLHKPVTNLNQPIFIDDGQRRRAALTFEYLKGKLSFGFNETSSHKIVNIEQCLSLTPEINRILSPIKNLLIELCSITYQTKQGKKLLTQHLQKGDVLICEADNGLDIVLEYNAPIDINTRMIIADFCQNCPQVIRISHRTGPDSFCETLLQKAIPFVTMGKFSVHIPAGNFLQASRKSEQVIADLVIQYLGETSGKIADLFCGVGTFSYYITSAMLQSKILAVDSGAELLQGFKDSLNSNQIHNIEIKKQNLFKYPLTADEISSFHKIVFDPPRAGAKEQCQQIASATIKPEVVVAVSCNPNTFVNDANILIDAGYTIQNLTLVDQFAYSPHSELVAQLCLTDNK